MLNVGEFGPIDETWSASHRRSEVRVLNLPETFYHSHSPSTVSVHSYVVLVHKGSSVVQVFKCCTTPPPNWAPRAVLKWDKASYHGVPAKCRFPRKSHPRRMWRLIELLYTVSEAISTHISFILFEFKNKTITFWFDDTHLLVDTFL